MRRIQVAIPVLGLLTAGLLVAGLLTGCTHADLGANHPVPFTGDPQHAQGNKQNAVYRACMSAHGVHEPDSPGSDPTIQVDGDLAQLPEIIKACQKSAGMPAPNPAQASADLAHRRKNAQCMRDNGYPNWPDPDPNNPAYSPPPGVDMNKASTTLSMCMRKAG